ncbi:probable fibrosin-1 isoform X2 [Rhinatrema bivittatum]|uniref:probable fibrosin-1 isoform X2 n=1 Tax=Rhinatrema bivittatum TaxID=194408 RepID=UPI0011289A69|nr:probable fibrosin-1 isoform X2 [Rhinatrema bivittatum]
MEAPACSRGSVRQQRRSKSQRDRDRRRLSAQTPPLLAQPPPLAPGLILGSSQSRTALAVSASSGSEQEHSTVPSCAARPRPPRRRRKEAASSCEEEIIDGFAIASFVSLEALEKDIALKPPERLENRLKHTGKRKRGQENRSELEEPENSSDREQNQAPGERNLRKLNKRRKKELPLSLGGSSSVLLEQMRWVHGNKSDRREFQKSSSRGMASDASLHSHLETGYICDTESDSDEKASSDGLDASFTISTSKALDPNGALHGSSEAKFSILPKISGLERSHEKNQEPDKDLLLVPFLPKDPQTSQAASPGQTPAPICTSAQASTPVQSQCQTPHLQTTATSRATPQPKAHTSQGLHPTPVHLKVPPFNPQSQGIYNGGLDLSTVSSNRSSVPNKPLAPSSQISHRPSTPSLPLSLNNHSSSHSFPSALRPPSHHHPSMFTSSPGLPPPPPLLQVAGHPAAAAAVAAATVLSEQELIRQDLSSRFLTTQGGAEMSTTIRPMFQFHQHNHQHQHTHQHTHQHFTPFPPSIVPAPAPNMFDKYPGKIDGLYRQNFYTAFSPSVSGIPPVLPPTVSFGSLQGAFQPKSTNTDLPTRLGGVPPGLPQKAPQITDPFRSTLRKPGKWCAMHVRVAYMILRHQEKIKLVQGDPHKLDFRNDLITCLPNSGAFGTLSHTHELARPATLFTPTGAIHPSGPHYGPPSASHSSFLSPAAHIDPFGRTTGFTPLGALSNGAFGGLGNPTFNANAMFSQKDSPGAQGFSNPHDPWNRLHRTPPSFPTAPAQVWSKTAGEAERGLQETEKQETLVIKDEKDRDILFARHTIRNSPATPSQKLPMGNSNGQASVEEEQQWGCGNGNSDLREKVRSRSHSREHPEALKDQKLREAAATTVHCMTEENLVLVRDTSKAATRELSPYIRAPIGESGRPSSRSSGDRKPQLTPEFAGKKQEVKVKEERKDDHDVVLSSFEMAQLPRNNGALHAGVAHGQAAMHLPLHMPPAGMHSLSVFERPRGMTPFLGHTMGVADRFPHASYALEAWREPYRSVELERREQLSRELALRVDPLQRLAGPRFYEREPERAGIMEERAHILREDYERARLYSLHPTGLEAHLPHHHSLLTAGLSGPLYSRMSPSMIHQNGILGKAPPMNMLSAPPPLIPSASTRPGSPRRTTPLTASDIRDLSSTYKDRDSR